MEGSNARDGRLHILKINRNFSISKEDVKTYAQSITEEF
jgi:hypothetical protein